MTTNRTYRTTKTTTATHATTLIKAAGTWVRLPGNSPVPNFADTISNVVANGWYADHKSWGHMLVIEQGPNRGMWLPVAEGMKPSVEAIKVAQSGLFAR